MNVYHNRLLSYFVWRFMLRKPRLRVFLTNLLIPDEDIDIELFGAPLRVNRRREIGYVRAYKNSKSNIVFRDEAGPLINLALVLAPIDTFVDIGANVGLYSSIISKLSHVYPQIKFYAFEAHPETARRLRESLKGRRNVEVFDFALSNKIGRLEFAEGATSGVFGARAHISGFQIANRTQIVEARTLDSVGIVGNSVVLKVDVEGHEREVLEGGSGLFKDGRVKAVYLDGYGDKTLPSYFLSQGFLLFDGRTLKPVTVAEHSLLAIHKKYVDS